MVTSICILLYLNPDIILPSMLEASENTLKLCISLCAIYSIWMGILQVMEDSGINKSLSKFLSPVTKKLFGNLDPVTNELICMNISCNILGMGGAATPLGMRAMKRLDDGSGKANRAMIMLIIFASTSMQILPTTVLGLRITAGSESASDIVLPTVIVAISTTLIGVCIALFIEFIKSKNRPLSLSFNSKVQSKKNNSHQNKGFKKNEKRQDDK